MEGGDRKKWSLRNTRASEPGIEEFVRKGQIANEKY